MNKLDGIFSNEEYAHIMNSMHKTACRNATKFQERFPELTAENGIYKYFDDFYDACHGGWWTGIFYILYGYSGDKKLLHYADILRDNFYTLIKTKRIYHREMGFIYQPICVNDMRYSSSHRAGEMLLLASDYMIERFCETLYSSGYGAYKGTLVKSSYLINLIILHAAGKISGLSKYSEFADRIEKLIFENLIEPDGYCHMDVLFDGEIKKGSFSDEILENNNSINSYSRRGCVWLLFGLAVFYSYKKEPKYLETFDLVISNLLNDSKINNNKNKVFNLDTTSLSILCCALAELLKALPVSHNKFVLYKLIYKNTMRYLAHNFFLESELCSDAFLEGGRFVGHMEESAKSNSPTVCGDYHFLQAMVHIDENYVSCWNICKLL